jgi:hypothetical protein
VTNPQSLGSPAGGSEMAVVIGINELRAQAARLGLQWQLRPANVASTGTVTFDGDTELISAVSLIGHLYIGARVMCVTIPPDGTFIIGHSQATLRPGMMVGFYTQETAQTTATGIFEPAELNAPDYFDIMQAHDPAVNNSRFTPSVPGWYGFDGSVTFASNATGRRATRWAKNGVTSPGSNIVLPSAAGATAYPAKTWAIYMNGQGDYVELEIWQESTVPLDTAVSSESTTHMKVTYLGSLETTP